MSDILYDQFDKIFYVQDLVYASNINIKILLIFDTLKL